MKLFSIRKYAYSLQKTTTKVDDKIVEELDDPNNLLVINKIKLCGPYSIRINLDISLTQLLACFVVESF